MTTNALSNVCACGVQMREAGHARNLVCDNCDFPQPIELEAWEEWINGEIVLTPKKRVVTRQDHEFRLTWAQRMRNYYPKAA